MVHLRFSIHVIVLQLLLKKDIKIVCHTLALPVPYFFLVFPYPLHTLYRTHALDPYLWFIAYACTSLSASAYPLPLRSVKWANT